MTLARTMQDTNAMALHLSSRNVTASGAHTTENKVKVSSLCQSAFAFFSSFLMIPLKKPICPLGCVNCP